MGENPPKKTETKWFCQTCDYKQWRT